MMHTCPPPHALLSRWLRGVAHFNGKYGHLLFEQAIPLDDQIVKELRPYFESAHQDAREVFHRAARIDLHPDAAAPGSHAQYPNCLPRTAQKGLFGEVMAGLLTQGFKLIGSHFWTIPVFLFRYHAEVEAYMFDLARDPTRVREVSGRHGNDFIALSIDPSTRQVVRFIAGEAKWRTDLKPSTMETLMLGNWTGPPNARVRANNGVWHEMNTGLPVPRGLEQLNKVLREKAPDEYAEAIVSLDRALLVTAKGPERMDLVLVAGNRAPTRKAGASYLPVSAPPPEYTAGRSLQVIELVLEDGGALIERLYDSLWRSP